MDVQSSIVKTLAFFNLFNHPLTNFELYKWLYSSEPVSLLEVIKAVRPKAEETIRQDRAIVNDRKFRLAQKAARLVSWVPFVKLVAVCNTLAFGAAEEWSDIDFFIIAKAGRIWTVRFFVTVILSFFRLRRHGRKITNRVCLSFFVTDDNLDLQRIALSDKSLNVGDGFKPSPTLDIYLIYWITQLVPLINRDQTLEKFWQANAWVKDYLANFSFTSQLPDERQIKVAGWIDGWRRLHERVASGRLGDWREGSLRWLQLKKIANSAPPKGGSPVIHSSGVVISDQMLKFHEEDRREEYRRRWEGR